MKRSHDSLEGKKLGNLIYTRLPFMAKGVVVRRYRQGEIGEILEMPPDEFRGYLVVEAGKTQMIRCTPLMGIAQVSTEGDKPWTPLRSWYEVDEPVPLKFKFDGLLFQPETGIDRLRVVAQGLTDRHGYRLIERENPYADDEWLIMKPGDAYYLDWTLTLSP